MQNITKNWIAFLTRPNKLQFLNNSFGNAFDTEFCITFSALKIVQCLLNFQIENRLISTGLIAWLNANGYMNASGQVDLSPRFTGTLAHTTIYGNTQWNVMNCIYAYGVIPEKMHPNQADSWNEYADPTLITQTMKDLGAEFIKRLKIEIDDATLADLINSPLWATVKFADGDGILSPIGADNHGVAVVDDGDGKTFVEESDTYWQEIKKYARTAVHNLNKFTINEIVMPTFLQTLLKRGLQYVLLVAPVGNYKEGVYKILPSGVYADTDKQDLYDAGVNALKTQGKLIGISPDDFKKLI
jgi:hypothetical protein